MPTPAAPAYIPQSDPYSIPAGFKTTTTPQGGTAYQDGSGNLYTRDAGGFKLQTSLPGNLATTPAPGGGTIVSPNPVPNTNVAVGSGYVPPPPSGTPAAPSPVSTTYPWTVTSFPGDPNASPEKIANYNQVLNAVHGIAAPTPAPAAPAPAPVAPAAAPAPAAPAAPPVVTQPPPAPGTPAPGTTPPPTATSPTSNVSSAVANLPNLAPGMTSNAVKTLQDFLVKQGYLTAAQVATGPGTYGPQTTAAVAAWQKANGIDVQGNPGYFGPISKAFLTQNGDGLAANGAPAGTGAAGTTVSAGTSINPNITAQDYYKKPDESIDQYNARIATLRGDTSTPEGAAATALSNSGSTTTPNDFATDPVKAVTDAYTQIYDSLGLAPVKTQIDDVIAQMSKIDTDLQDKIQEINSNPWISEALRSKEIISETNKAHTLKADQAKILSLYQGIYDKGIQQAQFVTTQAVGIFKQQQQFDQQNALQATKTADTIAVNSAKGAGLTTLEKNYLHAVQYDHFTGSLLDFQKEMTKKSSSSASTFAFTAKQLAALASKGMPSDAANNILAGIEAGTPLDQIRQNMKSAGYDPGLLDSIMYYVDPANNKPGA